MNFGEIIDGNVSTVKDLITVAIVDGGIEFHEHVQTKKPFDCQFENLVANSLSKWRFISDINWQDEANANSKAQDPDIPPEDPRIVTSKNKLHYMNINLNFSYRLLLRVRVHDHDRVHGPLREAVQGVGCFSSLGTPPNQNPFPPKNGRTFS
jgi:hypothetical protein